MAVGCIRSFRWIAPVTYSSPARITTMAIRTRTTPNRRNGKADTPALPALCEPVQDVQGQSAEAGRHVVAGGERRIERPAPVERARGEHAAAARELAPDCLRCPAQG